MSSSRKPGRLEDRHVVAGHLVDLVGEVAGDGALRRA